MLLNFRQGLVRHQIPTFFNITFPTVDLIVDDTNLVVAFAAGAKDYLHTEQESVPHAWGPTTLGRDQWLYWDINTRTGKRTFGITLVQPITSPIAPTSVATDQHWFDTSTNTMNVWGGHGWIKRIRTFAFKLANGRVPVSMGPTPNSFIGTQIGNTTPTYAGHILFDASTTNAYVQGVIIDNITGDMTYAADPLIIGTAVRAVACVHAANNTGLMIYTSNSSASVVMVQASDT